MKKTIVASILGVVASVVPVGSSYGQGYVFFNNYDATTHAAVTWANTGVPAGKAGLAVGNLWKADLLYQFGGGALTPAGVVATFFGATDGDLATGAGYFQGPIATIPNYSGGAITFVVRAFLGTDFATALYSGQQTFTIAGGIPNGTPAPPAGSFGAAFLPFTVTAVPEPSALALIGLGTGALLFLRRRK